MKLQSYLIFIILLASNSLSGQCEITNISTTSYACDASEFELELTFEHQQTETDSFQILYNGIEYGNYAYSDLPVQLLSIPVNCSTIDSLFISDINDPQCYNFKIITNNCCDSPCTMEIEYLVNLECNGIDGNVAVLELGDGSGFSELFQVYQDNELIKTSAYLDLPLDLELDNDEFTTEIVVCDFNSTICCDTLTHASTCTCAIYDLAYSLSECNDSSFFVNIDFEYIMVSDSFELGGNGMSYGTYAYDELPVSIGPLFFVSIDYEIVIFEQINAFCFNFIDLGVVENCFNECSLTGLIASSTECNDQGMFDISFDFQQVNVIGSSFEILINGAVYDTLEYQDEAYLIGPFSGDCMTQYEIFLRDIFDPNCFSNLGLIGTVCCEHDDECLFQSFSIIVEECSEDQTFNIQYDIEVSNPGNNGFLFLANGLIIDSLAYGSDGYISGPFLGDCLTLYDFSIQDIENPECTISESLNEAICCDTLETCVISNINFEISECTEDQEFFIDYTLDIINTESTHFQLFVNNVLIDSFAYNIGQYSIGPITADCISLYDIYIEDQIDATCNTSFSLNEPVCCETNDTCFINQFIVNAEACKDQLFDISFSFNSPQNQSGSFTLNFNATIIDTFEYGDSLYTAGPFLGDCSTNYRFQLIDLNDLDCFSNLALLGPICCETDSACMLSDLAFSTTECDSLNNFSLVVNFDYNDFVSDSFSIYTDGNLTENIAYTDLPITVNNLVGSCDTHYDMFIHDIIDSSCFINFVIDNPICCNQDSCDIGPINVIDLYCTNNLAQLEYTFEFSGTSDSYTISINGQVFSNIEYSKSIQQLNIPDFLEMDSVLVSFCDSIDSTCCQEITLYPDDCFIDCGFNNLSLDTLDCDSIYFSVLLSGEFESDSIVIDILLDSMFYGQYNSQDFPIEIGPLIADGSSYEVIAINTDNLCSRTIIIPGLDCIADHVNELEQTEYPFTFINKTLQINDSLNLIRVNIFDINSRSVKSTNNYLINLEDLTTGIYIVNIASNNIMQSYKLFVH